MIEFGVLGPLSVVDDGSPVALGRSLRRVLAALLSRANNVITVGELTEAVWETDRPRNPRKTLHVYMHRLRGLLRDGALIAVDNGGYALAVDAHQVDALRFEELVAQGRVARLHRNLETARDLLRQSLRLWRGRAYATVAHGPLIADEARRLDEQYLLVQEERFEIESDLGLDAESVGELVELAAANPFRERLSALLMRALQRAGRRVEALEVFRNTRAVLVNELGVEPGPDLQRAHQAVLREEVSTASRAVTAGCVPRQLPVGVVGFVGRDRHVMALDRLLPRRSLSAGPTIAVITGTAGIGKSALAIHWGHRVADAFPDGHLYLNLMGFGPDAAVDPAEALAGLLVALGRPRAAPPSGLEAQAGLLRTRLADKRILMILDNARDVEQVRPLLPGAPGCLVLVTSRDPLLGLVTATGAHPVRLDVLSVSEARELLARRLGVDRLAAEPGAVDRIIDSSARLPLALAVAASHAATHPERSLDSFADELEADSGLDLWSTGDASTDLSEAFSWSYRALGSDAARVFRCLGRHGGPDISSGTAAALTNMTPQRARAAMAELRRAGLVDERHPGRYGCHRLLRLYARQLADSHPPVGS